MYITTITKKFKLRLQMNLYHDWLQLTDLIAQNEVDNYLTIYL